MKYYVSADVKQAGDGTKEKPFATIQEAAQIARAGDEVIVAPGNIPGVSGSAMCGYRRGQNRISVRRKGEGSDHRCGAFDGMGACGRQCMEMRCTQQPVRRVQSVHDACQRRLVYCIFYSPYGGSVS